MKRFDIFILFTVFLLSSTVLFQNCSEMESSSANNGNSDRQLSSNDNRVVPEFLSNRQIDLDNKQVANVSLATRWSTGSTDTFYYETDYQATYESTLVTITGENREAVFTVTSDDCNESKVLSDDESLELSDLFDDYIPLTSIMQRQADEVMTEGCSFPRLILDATQTLADGSDPVDFDIYFSTPECTPDSEFYVSNRNGNDPVASLNRVQAYFNSHIDDVCN